MRHLPHPRPFLPASLALALAVFLVPGPASADAAVAVKTAPAISPAFSTSVSDYTTSCEEGVVSVAARARGRETIAVDGAPLRLGRATAEVPLQPGQSFQIRTGGPDGKRSHYVRCLPGDYPDYEFSQQQRAAAGQYAFTPSIGVPRGTPTYVAIFDEHGAPIWWLQVKGSTPVDAQVLSDGRFAFGHVAFLRGSKDGYEIRDLDGVKRLELHALTGRTDTHELLELEGGGYTLLSNPILSNVDLRPYGGPEDAMIFDNVIEERDADGELVWSWSTYEHVGLEEGNEWWPNTVTTPEQVEGVGPVYNPFHINSVEPIGRGYLVSFRRTNSIYRITRGGEIEWKLGGTKTPESLAIRGDELRPRIFGGQHDARVHEDGTVTVLDNGTFEQRPPRALRWQIDTERGRAKLIDEQRDAAVPASTCCGSVRPVGDAQVISWGADYSAEYGAEGEPHWQLRTPGVRTYRVVPIEDGLVSDAELRAGMDAMAPRRPPECDAAIELLAGRAGTPGDDELRGRRDLSEYLRGLAGDDRLDGSAGDDCVLGDGGDDRIEGGPGDDQLIGGAGDDRIEGGRGVDEIDCGGGDDIAIVKGGDLIDRNCERVRRAGAPKGGKGKPKGGGKGKG